MADRREREKRKEGLESCFFGWKVTIKICLLDSETKRKKCLAFPNIYLLCVYTSITLYIVSCLVEGKGNVFAIKRADRWIGSKINERI